MRTYGGKEGEQLVRIRHLPSISENGFIVRDDDLASNLRIEERELEAGGLNQLLRGGTPQPRRRVGRDELQSLRSTLNRLAIQPRRKAQKPSFSCLTRRGPPAMNRACFSSVTGMRLAGGGYGRATRQRVAGPTVAGSRYPVGLSRGTTSWGRANSRGPRSHCDWGDPEPAEVGGQARHLSVDPRKPLSPRVLPVCGPTLQRRA